MANYTKVNLKEVEDMAPKHGLADNHEARFASKALGLQKAGLSYQKLLPGKRSLFGHKHIVQEELFIVLGGSGQMKLDDDIIEVKPWDAVRVPPETMRALAAGSDGLEFIIFGAPKTEERDWEMTPDWWKR